MRNWVFQIICKFCICLLNIIAGGGGAERADRHWWKENVNDQKMLR